MRFNPSLAETREVAARERLLALVRRNDLSGLSVVDIGCGDGTASLAAVRCGAGRVISFDTDPAAISATRALHAGAGSPPSWTVETGSILDERTIAALGRFDIVHAWGVLHHTDNPPRALANMAALVAPTGRLCLAFYSRDTFVDPPPEHWLGIKRRYHQAPGAIRWGLEAAGLWWFLRNRRIAQLPEVKAMMADYRNGRGGTMISDFHHWLCGWPMTILDTAEMAALAVNRAGLDLVGARTGEAMTETVFVRQGMAEALGYRSIPLAHLPAGQAVKVLSGLDQIERGRPLYIFGTARGADLLIEALRETPDLDLGGFIDIERDDTKRGFRIHRIDQFVTRFPPETPVLLSNRYVLENGRRLLEAGFRTLYNGHPLVMRLASR